MRGKAAAIDFYMMKMGRKIVFILLFVNSAVIPCLAQNYYSMKIHPDWTRRFDEMAPVMVGDTMVYCSNRPVSGPRTGTDLQSRTFYKIVEREKNPDGTWKPQRMFDESLSSNFHDGPVSFNANGDYMVFSRCFDNKTNNKTLSKFGLFFADKQNGRWGNIQEFEFNDSSANTIYPSFNKDATLLYFSSDRAGGFGGYDLYVSRFQDGKWTTPENLGPGVNSADDERFPFIHSTGRLYFSSNGHDNRVGGYDLFYSEFYNGKWIIPIKLPSPFNSGANDITYYVDDKFENGFFTSDRRGSRDIYTFSSTIPNFEVCQQQRLDNYCFVFFEENTVELDTSLYLYEWNLGDNTKIRDIEAKHCYQGQGKYVVSLNVIDKLTKEVLFNQAEYELNIEKIVQAFITCPDQMKMNEDIQFSGLESYFKDAKPGEYYWDFGDGIKGVGASVRHKYVVPGSYIIKLGVTEDNPDAKEPREFCSFKPIVVTEN
jgi:hypothetical protein